MDAVIWRASMRPDFPYNLDLKWIVGVPFILPMAYIIFDMAVIAKNFIYLKTILLVLLMSICGYVISDKMIDAFKEKLCEKGQFGRDLNKAGVQKEKVKVPESLGIVTSISFLCCSICQQVTLSFT